MAERWDLFVDLVTIVWLSVFIIGYLFEEFAELCSNVNLSLLPVFIADLLVKYRRVKSLKVFIRERWFDILTTVPWFRVLRPLRAVKVLRTARMVRISKGIKKAKVAKRADVVTEIFELEKYYKFYRKLKRIFKRLLGMLRDDR